MLEPACRLAENGFTVSKSLACGLRNTRALRQFEESRRVFQNGGAFYNEGDLFKQPDLAATLRRLQKEGPGEFYTGETARMIAADQAEHGGLITLKDLAAYRAVERAPLRGRYRGHEIIAMPPPSSGGIALLEMLHILEPYDLAALQSGAVRTDHLLIETMRRAFADRAEFAGDPDFVKVPVAALTSERYAANVAATIDLEKATPSARIGHGRPARYESPETTHFSVVDAAGNAVSNTYTLNMGYGSGVTVKGAGFLLNDEMDDFAAKPGTPNGFGLIQGEANAIAPRKRPLSSMTPTIVLKEGRLLLVTGSPGGPTIITTVLQTLIHVIDHKMDLPQAVAAPRLHHQWMPDEVRAERSALTDENRARLEAMGHRFAARAGAAGEVSGRRGEHSAGARLRQARRRHRSALAGRGRGGVLTGRARGCLSRRRKGAKWRNERRGLTQRHKGTKKINRAQQRSEAMQLSEAQIRFLGTFGYLGFPGLFSPEEAAWITEEFETAIRTVGGGDRHDGSARTMFGGPIERTTKLCTLLDDPRIVGLLSGLIGEDFNYCSGDGNYYTGDTGWHPDGNWGEIFAVKIAFYLDPVRRETGCLRVLPGSQDPDHFVRRQKIDLNKSRELFGIAPRDFPGNVALETNPGDLVIFNHDTYHSSWGGSTRRRMFTMNCTRHYHTDHDRELGLRYLRVHTPGGYKVDTGAGMYFPLMLDTASPQRMIHLAQPAQIHDELFPELARKR